MAMPDEAAGTVQFLNRLAEQPESFLQPTSDLAVSALALVKELLDPLATEVANQQKERKEQNRRKRKREEGEEENVLQLRKVHTSGVGVRQIWEQARRVLDAACDEVEREIERELPQEDHELQNGDDINGLEEEHLDIDGEMDEDELMDTNDDHEDQMDEDDGQMEDDGNGDLDDEDLAEMEEDDLLEDEQEDGVEPETYVPDPNGLNDGFFSIDDFNNQSQFLEQMDARGDDDNPSDEDEVDWDADPGSLPLPNGRQLNGAAEDGDLEDDDEEGPTFGNADLDASESEDEFDGDEGDDLDAAIPTLNNTNDIKYADFFEPPPKKLSKTKRMRALPKTQPPKATTIATDNDRDLDADIQRAMDDANRDIFASESGLSASDDASDSDAPQIRNMSTHEKQRAKITAEIRRLEAANVAKRDWTLSGEARAADRPFNSLIEEDLEFERIGKPVPVVTAETSEEIEALIKRRIIAREFDEVIRRRPDTLGSTSDARRGRIEVDDRKAETGLADIYEQEHLKSTDPNYVDKRSAATKKQHAEIDKLWKEVSYQLDLLSNLHFKPKRLHAEIKTVEDKPTISMEDARPVGEIGDSMLAPQEVYRAGEDGRRAGEVVRRSGKSESKEEMTREEKVRRRRREKERMKKQGTNVGPGAKKDKKSASGEKQDIFDNLKKGGVKVIDKKGELQSLAKQKGQGVVSSSALKL